jgi:hypothetical protein
MTISFVIPASPLFLLVSVQSVQYLNMLVMKSAVLVAAAQRTLGAGENHKLEFKPSDLSIELQRDHSKPISVKM